MRYPLSILKCPTGVYMFVGSVPQPLAYRCDDAEVLAAARQCGPGWARKIAERRGITFETATWPTYEAAKADAEALGYSVA